MNLLSHSSKRRVGAVASIVSRNVFLLINGIIFVVVILLVVFGDIQEGIFLGLITVVNMVLGGAQEINAWLTLEKLQLLAVPRVIRINADTTESTVSPEEIKAKDSIKLNIGDQVPCDGVLIASHGFEANEALLTGESNSFLRKPGDQVFAGSIVTSGSGVLQVEKIFAESRIALMTKSIKKYSLILSPIQQSINTIIEYTGYVLLLVIFFVAGRGFLVHESTVAIIQSIGALTSALLPQGMVVIVTLLFSYGAAHMYRRNVLLQEVNATEKFGRIKNLCMDKTGTLTDTNLVVERIHGAPGMSENYIQESIAGYIKSTGDASKIIEAIKKTLVGEYSGSSIGDLPFSSSRQFGAAHVQDEHGERVVFAGAPEIFLPHFSSAEDRAWVQNYIDTEAVIGKRLLCFVESSARVLPTELSGVSLSAVAVFALGNNLREGATEAIRFFQDRGVIIRIISGDNPKTVQAVALAAGVQHTDSLITGTELEAWTEADFLQKARAYTIFARIKPEQKEKIIEALRHDGFTAMIGDGANDALAIKKADLGIALFDGAQATRQIASVVLVKNSFSDLPNGVRLADSIIQNIELCASVFFNQVFLGFFFFIMLALLGYSFPFTPLNITFINYFTVGLPGFLIFYWILHPAHTQRMPQDKSFLRQVIPFALISAIPQALVAVFAFQSSLEHVQARGPTSLVVVSCIILGVIFFMYAPKVYGGQITSTQRKQLFVLGIVEIISVVVLIKIPLVATFYNLKVPSLHSVLELVPLIVLYALVQYGITKAYCFVDGFQRKVAQ